MDVDRTDAGGRRYEARVVDGGRIVGSLRGGPRTLPDSPIRYAEITHLEVGRAHRRRGIGTALVADFRRWAGEHGYERVSVEASATPPRAALQFSESCGLVQRSVVLDAPTRGGR